MVANLNVKDEQHAANMIRFAIRAHEEASKVPSPDKDDGTTLQMRVGKWRDIMVSNVWISSVVNPLILPLSPSRHPQWPSHVWDSRQDQAPFLPIREHHQYGCKDRELVPPRSHTGQMVFVFHFAVFHET